MIEDILSVEQVCFYKFNGLLNLYRFFALFDINNVANCFYRCFVYSLRDLLASAYLLTFSLSSTRYFSALDEPLLR